MRQEIRISGFGGQGIGLAGFILGKAIALYSGKEAVMTQSYGPEARGGASSANIVLSEREIAYPFVQQPDILVAMSQEAYSKFRNTIKDDAVIIIEEDLVQPNSDDTPFKIPATRMAEGLGRRIVSNIVMLGYLTAVTELIDKEAMIQAIRSSVPEKTVPLNLEAFEAGYAYSPQEAKVQNE